MKFEILKSIVSRFWFKLTLVCIVFIAGIFLPSLSFSFIPPIGFILEKSAKTTGKEIYSIDQEVIFNVLGEEVIVKENWLVEGDKNLKLSAYGQGALKQNVSIHTVYNSKVKTQFLGATRQSVALTTDFFQKYFFIRSSGSFTSYLSDLSISPEVRISRVDGRIGYALGKPTETRYHPQIWIDQEEFMVRKIRLPSETEVELSDFQEVKAGFQIARTQKITWGGVSATVKVMKVTPKPKESLNAFYPQYLDTPSVLSFPDTNAMSDVITNFYKRFR